MKTTQTWGWLAAGVLAAGLNASYHDGGLPMVHQVVSQMEQGSQAVLALATGRADQLLAEARLVAAQDETASCRLSTALARAQTRMARSQTKLTHVEAMSASDEAQLDQFEASRAQIEAQVAEAQALVQANFARIRIPALAMSPVVVSTHRVVVCPRIRVNIPQPPLVRIPAVPVIHIETSGTGPI